MFLPWFTHYHTCLPCMCVTIMQVIQCLIQVCPYVCHHHEVMTKSYKYVHMKVTICSRKLWLQLENWIYNNLETYFSFTEWEIIFGIPLGKNNIELKIVNYLILLGKWYINKCRSSNTNVYFIELLNLTKNKLDCAKYILKLHIKMKLKCLNGRIDSTACYK